MGITSPTNKRMKDILQAAIGYYGRGKTHSFDMCIAYHLSKLQKSFVHSLPLLPPFLLPTNLLPNSFNPIPSVIQDLVHTPPDISRRLARHIDRGPKEGRSAVQEVTCFIRRSSGQIIRNPNVLTLIFVVRLCLLGFRGLELVLLVVLRGMMVLLRLGFRKGVGMGVMFEVWHGAIEFVFCGEFCFKIEGGLVGVSSVVGDSSMLIFPCEKWKEGMQNHAWGV